MPHSQGAEGEYARPGHILSGVTGCCFRSPVTPVLLYIYPLITFTNTEDYSNGRVEPHGARAGDLRGDGADPLRWSSPSEPSAVPVCGTLWMQRLSKSRLYPAQTGAWTPAPSARCGAATIMWSCTADPTIPPYLEQSPLRNIRRRALHITTWRYNFAAKLEIPTRRHLLHPFRGEHRLGTAR